MTDIGRKNKTKLELTFNVSTPDKRLQEKRWAVVTV